MNYQMVMKIAGNLNDHQSIDRRTRLYTFFSIFKLFFDIYLRVHCQDCQNNHCQVIPTLWYIIQVQIRIGLAVSKNY
jgi:hypothetical protein